MHLWGIFIQNGDNEPTLFLQQGGYVLAVGWIFWGVNTTNSEFIFWCCWMFKPYFRPHKEIIKEMFFFLASTPFYNLISFQALLMFVLLIKEGNTIFVKWYSIDEIFSLWSYGFSFMIYRNRSGVGTSTIYPILLSQERSHMQCSKRH